MKFYLTLSLCALLIFVWGCSLVKKWSDTNWSGSNVEVDSNGAVVADGNTISVNYIWKLEDGTVFDTSIQTEAEKANIYNASRNYEPLSFVVWAGDMIKWFDEGVVGMRVGETRQLVIPPEKAYGQPDDPRYQTTLNPQVFSLAGISPKVGEAYDLWWQRAKVLEITGSGVLVSFAPELAGKTLVFDVTVMDIK